MKSSKAAPLRRSTAPLRRFEALALLAVAAAVVFAQVMVPPIIGLADNGDFPRVSGLLSIGVLPAVANDAYFKYVIRDYAIGAPYYYNAHFVSSEVIPVALATIAHNLWTSSHRFDIRTIGAVHALLLLAALGIFFAATQRWSTLPRLVSRIAAILIFTDVSYVAFFNSFYSEPASMLFLLIALAAALLAWSEPQPKTGIVFLALAAAIAFVLAKPQNVIGGIVLAIVCWRAGRDAGKHVRAISTAGAILLIAASLYGYLSAPRKVRQSAYQVAVFHELFAHSPNAAGDARELGLDPALTRYSGLHPWSPGAPSIDDPAFQREFLEHISFGKLLAFYLRHPGRLWNLLDREASSTLRRRPSLGNYEKSSGRPPRTETTSFAAVGRALEAISPRSALSLIAFFMIVTAGACVVWLRTESARVRLACELIVALAAIGVSQFVLVSITEGEIDTVKHMFLTRLTFDVLLIAILAVAASTMRGGTFSQ
jgi:hypothetical protein